MTPASTHWAKHAAEAIVDDEQELAATEAARRRKKLLLTLAGIVGVAGLGALAYNQRENIGAGVNKLFGGPSDNVLDTAGAWLTRGAGAAAAGALPSKAVTNRLPFGRDIASLQKDITAAQTSAKDLSPAAERIAAEQTAQTKAKTNPHLVDRLNTLLADPKLVQELGQSGGAGKSLASMTPSARAWSRIKGGLSGQGFTQSQRDAAALPKAFEQLSQPARNPNPNDLQARVIKHLGLTGDSQAKLHALSQTGKMLAAHKAAPSRYMQARGLFGTPARMLAGAAAPELINYVGSGLRTLIGK